MRIRVLQCIELCAWNKKKNVRNINQRPRPGIHSKVVNVLSALHTTQNNLFAKQRIHTQPDEELKLQCQYICTNVKQNRIEYTGKRAKQTQQQQTEEFKN